MSNLPSTTVQLSTISAPSAAPKTAPETPTDAAAPPAPESGSGAVSDAGRERTAPDPDLEVAKRLETVSRREARIRRADAEHHERMTALSEKEKQITAKLEELDAALGDPVKYMLDKGKDPVEVARRFSKPETEEEKRIRKLEEADAERRANDEKRAKEWEEEQAQRRRMGVIRDFVGGINEREHPHLVAEYPDPNDIPELVTKLLNRKADPQDPKSPTMLKAFNDRYGRNPTDDEIREALEFDSERRATRIIESRSRRASAEAPTLQAPERSQKQPPAKTASGTSGISNQHASITNSGKPRPRTLEEKRREKRRELIESFEAEANERQ